MLRIGMIVDNRYRILREIGRGGTSCVYLAENIRLHNCWAIKEVYKKGASGAENMLITESSILTKLRHPGLPAIIDVLNTPESYLIVMEYIEGTSLDKVPKPCSEKNVLKWAQQLCDVLYYLHSQRPAIIYRDMKPANIILRPDGNVVLIDFGMAREFKRNNQHDTTNLGTHGYAAPEQYNGNRQSDARTDIYCMGVTIYHLVTGHDPCLPPYGISSICAIDRSLSPKLDDIIHKCTQLQPEQRYQSTMELKSALQQVQPVDRIAVEFNSGQESSSGKKWLWLCIAIPAVVVVLVLALAFGMSGETNPELNFSQDVYINEPDERAYYYFVPEKTGYYNIYSESEDGLPVIWLTDANDNLIDKDNTGGDYLEFGICCWLKKGETYYIETTLYDENPYYPATGMFWFYVEYAN